MNTTVEIKEEAIKYANSRERENNTFNIEDIREAFEDGANWVDQKHDDTATSYIYQQESSIREANNNKVRTEIASRNMAGILSNVALDEEGSWSSEKAIAEFALKCADSLIVELNKQSS